MKRALLHTGFWLAYAVQDVLLVFFLNTTRLHASTGENLVLSLAHVLILLMPKMLFSYFMLSIALNHILEEGFGKRWTLYSVIALVLTIFLYRGLLVFLVNPTLYGWHDETAAFFYPLGFPVALMDIGFVSGAAIALKQIRQQLTRAQTEQLLIKEKLETELKYLRNQTHPHFLFNTLNNIYALARKKSNDTPEAVMKLSKLLRFMLYEAAKPRISIGHEVRMLEDYIDLEKIRYDSKLTISFSRDIDDEAACIAPLLLLPFVENAFKHGASESLFASFIDLDIQLRDGILKVSVKNSKENEEPEDKDVRIGLKNVKRQLELLYSDYHMEVVNAPSVFLVLLNINLHSYAKNDLSYR